MLGLKIVDCFQLAFRTFNRLVPFANLVAQSLPVINRKHRIDAAVAVQKEMPASAVSFKKVGHSGKFFIAYFFGVDSNCLGLRLFHCLLD